MKRQNQICLNIFLIFNLFSMVITPFNIGQLYSSLYHNKINPAFDKLSNIHSKVRKGQISIKLKSSSIRSLKPGLITIDLEQTSLGEKLRRIGAFSVEKMFSHRSVESNALASDISRIIKVNIPNDLDPVLVALELSSDPNVEYAEPVYENLICEIPNDSLFNQQFYLIQINAPDAWDWQKGILSVTVAIVDNRTDYNHKDLRDNIWTNNREANGVFGVDDDGNGYIDDVHGWDFGNNDPDPRPFSPDIKHGTATAGIACAVTNNGIGMAGAGWNCKFMPIKSANDALPSDIRFGYQGIVYAADNGADIINVSWGTSGYTKVGQEAIQYAYDKGAVVVCAAGNYSLEVPFYPASYSGPFLLLPWMLKIILPCIQTMVCG